MKKIEIIIILLITSIGGLSQNKALSIGDKVPNIEFKNILQYKNSKATLLDFKGKLIILDFWSSACGRCIELFPEMQKLQNKFKDKLQIILVNGKSELMLDSRKKIEGVLKRVQERTGINITLPIIYNSKILDFYFPHNFIPHEVWIDGNGFIKFITPSDDVTEETIRAALANKKVFMTFKSDFTYEMYQGPLIFSKKEIMPGSKNITYSSSLVQQLIGVGYNFIKTDSSTGSIHGITIMNKPLIDFYSLAYPEHFKGIDQTRVFIDIKDSMLANNLSYNETYSNRYMRYHNLYNYDLYSEREMTYPELMQSLKKDLEKSFNLFVLPERRSMKCIILKKNDTLQKFNTQNKGVEVELYKYAIKKYLHNVQSSDVIRYLNPYFKTPLIDETGTMGNIDIDFPDYFDMSKTDEILKALEKAGLVISNEDRDLDVLVITDKKSRQ